MSMTENKMRALDIGIKGIFGAVIAAVVAYFGHTMQDERARVQEDNHRLQATVELTSRQKDFDVDLGMRLFGTLMGYYFQKDRVPGQQPELLRQQMLLLRLVSLNFLDVPIHLKPLFEDLDSQLSNLEDKQTLRGIAQEVAGRQAYRLTIEGGHDSGPREVLPGGELEFPELLTKVKIGNVSANGVQATIYSKVIGDRPVGPFLITHFDTPLVENIKLGEYRVALLLHAATADKAEVRFVAFPNHFAADRFDIKKLSRSFLDKK